MTLHGLKAICDWVETLGVAERTTLNALVQGAMAQGMLAPDAPVTLHLFADGTYILDMHSATDRGEGGPEHEA